MQLAFELDLPVETAPALQQERAAATPFDVTVPRSLTCRACREPRSPRCSWLYAPMPMRPGRSTDRVIPVIENAVGSKVDAVPGECRHVSLVGIGRFDDVPPGQIDKLDTILRELKARAFPAIFDRLMTFGPRGAVVMTGVDCVAPLRDFHDRVCDALRLPRHFCNFTPHDCRARAADHAGA